MNDYRAKFDNTKHFEKAIDVAYDSDKEYIRFLKQQLGVKDKMIEAVEEWMSDIIFQKRIDKKDEKLIKAHNKYCEEIK